MATTAAARLVFSLYNMSSPGKEVMEGEHCVVGVQVVDSADGSQVADGDVTAITYGLYDKTSQKWINGRSAVDPGSYVGMNYVGLNHQDNAIIPEADGSKPNAGNAQTHVLRATVTYTGPGGGVDTVIGEYEIPVRRLNAPA